MQQSVIIFGTSITSAYLSGGTMLFRALARGFIHKGWKVTFVEEYHHWLATHTDYNVNVPGLKVLRYSDRTTLDTLLRDRSLFESAQLVLKFSGSSTLHDRHLDEWLAKKKQFAGSTFILIYMDADAPMRLPYITGHPRFYLHKIISQYDGVWVMLGGGRAVGEYLAMGAKRAWYLPAAIDAEAFQPKEAVSEYSADLLFIGNPTYGRERALKQLFFDVAEKCTDMRFLLAGAEWDTISLPPNIRYTGYVPSERLPELYSSARLILNVTREEMATYGDAAALRLFEAAVCGACIVSDSWQGLDKLYALGEEILIVQSTEDVALCLKDIDWQRSRTIGQRARLRTLRDHTADIRMGTFLSLLANQPQ